MCSVENARSASGIGMGGIPDIFPDESCLKLAGLDLHPGQHYQNTSRGIVLLKSGHHRLRLHILHAEDRGGMVAEVIDGILENPALSEETFDAPSRPASIFRAMSRKCIDLLPDTYRDALRLRLHDEDAAIASRVARLLAHIHETAESYPDLDTLLHCYFRAEGVSPDKFLRYAKRRLVDVAGEAEFAVRFDVLRAELHRFAAGFGPFIGKAGTRRAQGQAEFSEAMEWLEIKLERLRARVEPLGEEGFPERLAC